MTPFTSSLLRAVEAVRPASGLLPETEDAWRKLEDAARASLAAAFRDRGASEKLAIAAADKTMGAPAGRLILHLAYSEVRRAYPAAENSKILDASSDGDHDRQIVALTIAPTIDPYDGGGAR